MPAPSRVDEYATVRNEQLYRVQSIHRLVATTVAGFFAAAVVIPNWRRPDNGGFDPEMLFWLSVILLAMVITAAAVLLRWLRLLYRAGSYVVAFYEDPDPAGQPQAPGTPRELGWISRIRRRDAPKGIIDQVFPGEGVLVPLIFLGVAGCVPIGMGVARVLCQAWPWSYRIALFFSVTEVLVAFVLFYKLAHVETAREEFLTYFRGLRASGQ